MKKPHWAGLPGYSGVDSALSWGGTKRAGVSCMPGKFRATTLERELATYESKLPELISEPGKYVLIKDDLLIGIYAAYADAIKVGYKKFGLDPFLVNQIQVPGNRFFISRPIVPVHQA
ncbi:MAG: hypothetical protein ACRD01_16935 [Terriglobales bacterium]